MGAWGSSQTSGNGRWNTPTPDNTNWRAPGHDRMFGGEGEYSPDPTGRMFTTRKKHGWWGPEERFDMDGNRID